MFVTTIPRLTFTDAMAGSTVTISRLDNTWRVRGEKQDGSEDRCT